MPGPYIMAHKLMPAEGQPGNTRGSTLTVTLLCNHLLNHPPGMRDVKGVITFLVQPPAAELRKPRVGQSPQGGRRDERRGKLRGQLWQIPGVEYQRPKYRLGLCPWYVVAQAAVQGVGCTTSRVPLSHI